MGRLIHDGRARLTAAAALVLLMGGSALAAPAGAPRVASVELRLPPGGDRAGLADLVAIAPGDLLSSRALRRTVLRLFQTDRFRDVVVRAVPVEGERGAVALVIECLQIRRVGTVRLVLEGDARPLDERQLRSAARLEVRQPFEENELEASVDTVFPIIQPPQVAIVGAGAMVERPWVVDGKIVPRQVLTLSLGADHRVTDGRLGAQFLARIAARLQSPASM